MVTMTCFYPVGEDNNEWRQQKSELLKEDWPWYNLVSDFHGGKPVHARPDYLLLNSDNTK